MAKGLVISWVSTLAHVVMVFSGCCSMFSGDVAVGYGFGELLGSGLIIIAMVLSSVLRCCFSCFNFHVLLVLTLVNL